jgi:hypothetical protein
MGNEQNDVVMVRCLEGEMCVIHTEMEGGAQIDRQSRQDPQAKHRRDNDALPPE